VDKIREDTFSRLKAILVLNLIEESWLKERKIELTPETRLKEDLGLDSFDKYELGYVLEKTLNVTIPDENMQGFKTLGNCVDYVDSQRKH